MGLDITAYEKAELVEASAGYVEKYDTWPTDIRRIYSGASEFVQRMNGRPDGYYRTSGETFHFRAGSYSGYNCWRAWLCQKAFGLEPEDVWANPSEYAGTPFYELVHFSDCEGGIGPDTSTKLAKDFAKFEESFCANADGYDDAKVYRNFKKAFEIAAHGGGFVVFH